MICVVPRNAETKLQIALPESFIVSCSFTLNSLHQQHLFSRSTSFYFILHKQTVSSNSSEYQINAKYSFEQIVGTQLYILMLYTTELI